jgi:hypothetical protein
MVTYARTQVKWFCETPNDDPTATLPQRVTLATGGTLVMQSR